MKKNFLVILMIFFISIFAVAEDVGEGAFSVSVQGGTSFMNVTDGLMVSTYGGGVQIVPFEFAIGNEDVSWILGLGKVGYSFRMTSFNEGNFFIHQIPISILSTGMNIDLFSFTVGLGFSPRWMSAEISKDSHYDFSIIVPFDISFQLNDYMSVCGNYTASFANSNCKFYQSVDVGVKFKAKYFE